MNPRKRLIRVSPDSIPETLQRGPHVGRCYRCDALVLWAHRDDSGNEIGTPLHPEAKTSGNFIIVGFTHGLEDNVAPLVADVRNVNDFPEVDKMPEWTRGKRWSHHSPECRGNPRRASLRRFE